MKLAKCVCGGVPDDTEGEDAVWPKIYHIRAAVEVGKVRKPGVVWESQIEHKLKGDSGLSVGIEIDKNSHVRRGGDLRVNQYHPISQRFSCWRYRCCKLRRWTT